MNTTPPPPEGFEWDRHKAHEKHEKGVSFHEAAETFEDLNSVEFVDDRENYGEERWVIIGMTKKKTAPHGRLHRARGTHSDHHRLEVQRARARKIP